MLMNLRNALMAGKRLPYDAELEYLESTGTQWIDTGAIIKYSDIAEAVASINNRKSIFGYIDSLTQQRFNVTGGGSNSYAYFGQATSSFGNTPTSYDTKYTFALGDGKFIVDGTIAGTREYTDNTLGGSLCLFARKSNGSINDLLKGKIYSFSVTRNGVKILDFIPVRKGTVGYLYDRVSKRLFGNQGTGDFVLGPDVVPVEWLGLNGGQNYIDTGLKYFPDFDIDVYVPNGQRNVTLLSGTYMLERISANTPVWRVSAGSTVNSSVQVYGRHQPTLHNKVFSVDNSEAVTMSLREWGENNCYMPSNSANGYVMRYYSALLYDANSVLVRSFRPVRVGSGSTWEGAMMDVLTRRIYRNEGTGAFTYGNDLRYPIQAE